MPLKRPIFPHIELLHSTPSTREAAGALGNIIRYLSDPASMKHLVTVYRVWRRNDREDDALNAQMEGNGKISWLNASVLKIIFGLVGKGTGLKSSEAMELLTEEMDSPFDCFPRFGAPLARVCRIAH